MAKKRKSKKNYTISAIAVVGIIALIAYQMFFGWSATLKIILGGVIFATFTAGLIQFLRGKLGNKMLKIR